MYFTQRRRNIFFCNWTLLYLQSKTNSFLQAQEPLLVVLVLYMSTKGVPSKCAGRWWICRRRASVPLVEKHEVLLRSEEAPPSRRGAATKPRSVGLQGFWDIEIMIWSLCLDCNLKYKCSFQTLYSELIVVDMQAKTVLTYDSSSFFICLLLPHSYFSIHSIPIQQLSPTVETLRFDSVITY